MAIIGSIVLAPFVFAALVAGLFKVVLTLLFPIAAGAGAELAAISMEAMRDCVAMLALLPGSDIPLPRPPISLVVLFYVLLATPFVPRATRYMRRGLLATATVGIAFVGFLAMFGSAGVSANAANVTARPDETTITLLSVGAGQCAVIAPPSGPISLVDCGSSTVRDPLRRCVAPFVRHLGRSNIDRVIVSHGDFDHISAATDAVTAYGVREVLTGPHFRRLAGTNPPAAAMLEFLERGDCDVIELLPGNRISLGGGCAIEAIWPERTATELSSNDSGLVLRISYAGKTILLPADLQEEGLSRLLAGDRTLLRADVLIAPHHGSAEQNTAEFLSAVGARFVISSNDRTLSRKQEDFARLIGPNCQLFRTSRDGAVTIRITRAGELSVTPFLSR